MVLQLNWFNFVLVTDFEIEFSDKQDLWLRFSASIETRIQLTNSVQNFETFES